MVDDKCYGGIDVHDEMKDERKKDERWKIDERWLMKDERKMENERIMWDGEGNYFMMYEKMKDEICLCGEIYCTIR